MWDADVSGRAESDESRDTAHSARFRGGAPFSNFNNYFNLCPGVVKLLKNIAVFLAVDSMS